MRSRSVARSKIEFNYNSYHAFFKFYKGYDDFDEMSLNSKYNRMKEFNKVIISFKSLKTTTTTTTTKRETQFKKERIMKNVDELYKKYYKSYKSDYETDDELKEDKKKKFDYKQFELGDEINKESTLDEKTEELELTELPEWLNSKNDFNEARKLFNNIGADTNKVRSSSGDEKVFNDLNALINDIQDKKTTRKSAIKKKKKYHF